MKILPKVRDILASGDFTGANKPHGRVTIEPNWYLHVTDSSIGTSQRGPYRYFIDVNHSIDDETEIPNIKSIQYGTGVTNDVGTCTIVVYNQWMEGAIEQIGKLGKPGYFWPEHGQNSDAITHWGELASPWENVIVPNSLIRCYVGYGGFDDDGLPLAISDAVSEGYITQKGLWRVDTVQGSTNGMMTITCRDAGSLLLDQPVFEPLVPQGLYPLQYWPAGSTTTRVFTPPGSYPTQLSYSDSSSDHAVSAPGSNSPVFGHKPSDAIDGNESTFAVSEGHTGINDYVWWEFNVSGSLNQIVLDGWDGSGSGGTGGSYQAYVCIFEGGNWVGGGGVVPGDNIPFVAQFGVNAFERGRINNMPSTYAPSKIRVYFTGLLQSEWGPSPNFWRGGLREMRAVFATDLNNVENAPTNINDVPHVFAMGEYKQGPGYITVDGRGNAYAFGPGATIAPSTGGNPRTGLAVISIGMRPQGDGYWLLDTNGRVEAHGSAPFYGDMTGLLDATNKGVEIVPTYTGLGYWIFLTNGQVRAFGDAPAPPGDIQKTALITFYEANGWLGASNVSTCFAAAGHPSQYGYWAINACGEIPPNGTLNVGGFAGTGVVSRTTTNGSGGAMQTSATIFDRTSSVAATKTGNGIWIISQAGLVWSFGDATNFGNSAVGAPIVNGFPVFEMAQQIVRNTTGNGYWVLREDGLVEDQGNAPSVYGDTVLGNSYQQPYPSNYNDIADIVEDLLGWSGWLLFDPDATKANIYGTIQTTGIVETDIIGPDEFDKKSVMDCIKLLKNVTGYFFYIDDEGAANFRTPNVWSAGNYVNGVHLPIIPELDERLTLTDYTVQLDGSSQRSQIIVSAQEPDPDADLTQGGTLYTIFTPNTSIPDRGICNPFIYSSSYFGDPTTQATTAELIGLQIFFAYRTGSITCHADPSYQIDDQIRIYERNTSDTYIHYIRDIQTSLDLETGDFTSTISTNWLGNGGNDWVITADPNGAVSITGKYVVSLGTLQRFGTQ